MRYSVVIPTFNRSEKLAACLKALASQEFDRSSFEIVVVDDGSQDDTQQVLERLAKKSPVPLYFFQQKNQGQGVARNQGVQEAHGEVVIFLGDDIVPTPQWLQEHDRIHRKHPEENAAGLGFVTWHPKLMVTALMRFMEQGGAILGRFGGHQFAYDLLHGKTMADFRFFYTANISLKRSLLLRFPFDPWFSGYGWEDIELGYRLTQKANLQLFYAPEAIGYHDHPISYEQWMVRMRNIGESAVRIHQKYPELGSIPSPRKTMVFRFLSHPFMLQFLKPMHRNLYFYALSKKYFLEGLGKWYRV